MPKPLSPTQRDVLEALAGGGVLTFSWSSKTYQLRRGPYLSTTVRDMTLGNLRDRGFVELLHDDRYVLTDAGRKALRQDG